MSKKIFLTIMTFAILLAGVLGINTKASAAKESTNKKSIDVIVGYKDYIRKVKVNGKITQLKYDKKYLKLTKNGNKIKFSEAFKAGKTTVTVKCKGCKTSKITVKIWKDELAWCYEFSRRWASNKKLGKKYLNKPNPYNKYDKKNKKYNKYKNLIIKNYDAKEMAAAKKAAGKYVKVKFYKGTRDFCCGNVVLLCNKNIEDCYENRIDYYAYRIYDAIEDNCYSHVDERSTYYSCLMHTLPFVRIVSTCNMDCCYFHSIYCTPDIEIEFVDTDTDETFINYDAGDEKALKKIIEAQVASGAYISTDLSNSVSYTWDKKTGRLIGIDWTGKNLKGAISFSKLTALKELNCTFNQLTSLDVSGCTALEKMDCTGNKLTSLDVSGNKALKELRLDGKVDLIGVSKDCNVTRESNETTTTTTTTTTTVEEDGTISTTTTTTGIIVK